MIISMVTKTDAYKSISDDCSPIDYPVSGSSKGLITLLWLYFVR